MKFLIVALVAALSAVAQQTTGHYTVEYSATLSNQTTKITVHLPIGETRTRIKFGNAMIYSSAACDWRTERDGTAPTATTVTPVKLNSYEPTAVFAAFRDSDVGAPARTQPTVKQLSGREVLDLTKENLKPGENLSLATPSNCSATYSVAIEVIQETY